MILKDRYGDTLEVTDFGAGNVNIRVTQDEDDACICLTKETLILLRVELSRIIDALE